MAKDYGLSDAVSRGLNAFSLTRSLKNDREEQDYKRRLRDREEQFTTDIQNAALDAVPVEEVPGGVGPARQDPSGQFDRGSFYQWGMEAASRSGDPNKIATFTALRNSAQQEGFQALYQGIVSGDINTGVKEFNASGNMRIDPKSFAVDKTKGVATWKTPDGKNREMSLSDIKSFAGVATNKTSGGKAAEVQLLEYYTQIAGGDPVLGAQLAQQAKSDPAKLKADIFKDIDSNMMYSGLTNEEKMKLVEERFNAIEASSPWARLNKRGKTEEQQSDGISIEKLGKYSNLWSAAPASGQPDPRNGNKASFTESPSRRELKTREQIAAEKEAASPQAFERRLKSDVAKAPREMAEQSEHMADRFGVESVSPKDRGAVYNKMAKTFGNVMSDIRNGVLPERPALEDALQWAISTGRQDDIQEITSALQQLDRIEGDE